MMKIITGSTGTAHVTSNNDGEFNQGIFGAGLVVLANGYHLEAQIKDANTITIKDGDLVFQGRHALIEPGTTEDVTIQTGSVGMNRNDLIVARYELDESTGYEKIILDVITGEESAGEPIDPAYVEGDIRTGALVAEVPLYRVKLSGININEVVPMFNFVPDLMGTVNQLKENLDKHSFGDIVDLIGYTNAPYVFNTDGYLHVGAQYGNNYLYYGLNGEFGAISSATGSSSYTFIPVKKGMHFQIQSYSGISNVTARFRPLV